MFALPRSFPVFYLILSTFQFGHRWVSLRRHKRGCHHTIADSLVYYQISCIFIFQISIIFMESASNNLISYHSYDATRTITIHESLKEYLHHEWLWILYRAFCASSRICERILISINYSKSHSLAWKIPYDKLRLTNGKWRCELTLTEIHLWRSQFHRQGIRVVIQRRD